MLQGSPIDPKSPSTGMPPSTASHAEGGPRPCTLVEFLFYFLKLGTTGFGGPIALAGYMQRDLVEQRGWISRQDYQEGLALAQLMPGPLAAQLAIYLGWVRAGVLGATLVSLAFVLPSFFMVLALSAVYVRLGGLSWMQGAFYGIGAAVIAIIARSAYKLVRATLGRERVLWVVLATSALTTAVTEREMLWLFLASGAVVLGWRCLPRGRASLAVIPPGLIPDFALAPPVSSAASSPASFLSLPLLVGLPLPAWLVTGLGAPASLAILWQILLFFTAAGAVVFGSGLAIVPFLYGGVVEQYQWLTEQQFLDAVAVAMITPGPVVITVAFIGYLVAGPVGAFLAGLGVFLPCYLLVIFPAPHFRRIAGNPHIKAFVDGVTAAATGAIAGASFVLGRRAIVDLPTMGIALGTLLALVYVKKLPEPLVILLAGVVGVLLKGTLG